MGQPPAPPAAIVQVAVPIAAPIAVSVPVLAVAPVAPAVDQ